MKAFQVYTSVSDEHGEAWSHTQDIVVNDEGELWEKLPPGTVTRECDYDDFALTHDVLRQTLKVYEEDRNYTGQAGIHWVMEHLDWRRDRNRVKFSAPPLAWEILDHELGNQLERVKWEVQE